MHEAPAGAQARSLRGGDTKVNLCWKKFRLGWRWGEFSQLLLHVPLPLRLLV